MPVLRKYVFSDQSRTPRIFPAFHSPAYHFPACRSPACHFPAYPFSAGAAFFSVASALAVHSTWSLFRNTAFPSVQVEYLSLHRLAPQIPCPSPNVVRCGNGNELRLGCLLSCALRSTNRGIISSCYGKPVASGCMLVRCFGSMPYYTHRTQAPRSCEDANARGESHRHQIRTPYFGRPSQ